MRFVGHGHAAIRATHTKTLEITADASITERATCIVAVGATVEPVAPLAGPVRITITVGDQSFGLDALANPSWDPTGPAVIRWGPLRLPGTLATRASAAAADLPRPLVDALRDPAARIEVLVEPVPGPPTVVLFAADPSRPDDPRLAAELAVADAVVAEDAGARALLAAQSAQSGQSNSAHTQSEQSKGARKRGRAAEPPAERLAGRLLVVATTDLPGASVPSAILDQHPIETVGLPARLAVAAACPSRAPLVLTPDGADPRALLRATPAGHRLVVSVTPDELGALLALAATERGTAAATVAQEYGPPQRVTPDALPPRTGPGPLHCCLHPGAASPTDDPLDPPVRAAVLALLADGVPTRTAARALGRLTGWPRRRAYEAVLALHTESDRR